MTQPPRRLSSQIAEASSARWTIASRPSARSISAADACATAVPSSSAGAPPAKPKGPKAAVLAEAARMAAKRTETERVSTTSPAAAASRRAVAAAAARSISARWLCCVSANPSTRPQQPISTQHAAHAAAGMAPAAAEVALPACEAVDSALDIMSIPATEPGSGGKASTDATASAAPALAAAPPHTTATTAGSAGHTPTPAAVAAASAVSCSERSMDARSTTWPTASNAIRPCFTSESASCVADRAGNHAGAMKEAGARKEARPLVARPRAESHQSAGLDQPASQSAGRAWAAAASAAPWLCG
mmetsp:Transcript_8747/g.22264  ORF Transcript_8747/g.22264 Transcript_8747/m.22264 type:complete len:303 (+) Transcript_8747:81-989(+)